VSHPQRLPGRFQQTPKLTGAEGLRLSALLASLYQHFVCIRYDGHIHSIGLDVLAKVVQDVL
jgi:hypothetical protein